MANILQQIARENFRSSGYITQPSRERTKPWQFTAPPKSPFTQTDTVHSALQRREKVQSRVLESNSSIFKTCLNALLHK